MESKSTHLPDSLTLPSKKWLTRFYIQRNSREFIALVVVIAIIGVVIGVLLMQKVPGSSEGVPVIGETPSQEEAGIHEALPYMQVGDEILYRQDFDYTFSMYPDLPDVDEAEVVKNVLIEESVILQAAQKLGWVTLDEQVFNSDNKDFIARSELVKQMKDKIEQEAVSRISGSVITVWFMNTIPGPVGYEAGRVIAEQKITEAHQKVKSGELTMKEAGRMLAADSSLAQIDPTAYAANAYFEFSHGLDQTIVFDEKIDAIFKNLNPGEVSDIYVAQDYEGSDRTVKKDAVFMFGSVTEKLMNEEIGSYKQWIEKQKQLYAVNYFTNQ